MINTSKSVYLQIALDIKKKIYDGVLKPGQILDTVRDLALTYEVTPKTIQNAFKALEEEGIITIRRSVGAFVVDDEEIIRKSKVALIESINNDYIENLKLASINLDEALELLKKGIK